VLESSFRYSQPFEPYPIPVLAEPKKIIRALAQLRDIKSFVNLTLSLSSCRIWSIFRPDKLFGATLASCRARRDEQIPDSLARKATGR
jgi:hypothetical protein